jgi:DNA-binding HxlR family transcriptional regulator
MSQVTQVTSSACCPVAKASQLIGDLWVILIVKELLKSPKRFTELEKAINNTDEIGDISSRTLSQRLKKLEADGLITRKVYKETPPHSEYSLTTKGQALSGIIEDIRRYGEQYL